MSCLGDSSISERVRARCLKGRLGYGFVDIVRQSCRLGRVDGSPEVRGFSGESLSCEVSCYLHSIPLLGCEIESEVRIRLAL